MRVFCQPGFGKGLKRFDAPISIISVPGLSDQEMLRLLKSQLLKCADSFNRINGSFRNDRFTFKKLISRRDDERTDAEQAIFFLTIASYIDSQNRGAVKNIIGGTAA